MCDDRQSVNISELLPLDSGSVHQAALWEEWLCAPRIGWQKDIFQMTRVAHAPKWMTCFISNDRLTAFTAHLLLAAPPPTLFSGSEASVIKRGGGNRRCRFSLGLREAERNACFLQVKATVGLWSACGQLRFQRTFSFWFPPNSTISGEAGLLVGRFPHF